MVFDDVVKDIRENYGINVQKDAIDLIKNEYEKNFAGIMEQAVKRTAPLPSDYFLSKLSKPFRYIATRTAEPKDVSYFYHSFTKTISDKQIKASSPDILRMSDIYARLGTELLHSGSVWAKQRGSNTLTSKDLHDVCRDVYHKDLLVC